MNEDTNTQPADAGRRLSDQLGPLPARTHFPGWADIPYYTAEQMHAYALQERASLLKDYAAERERAHNAGFVEASRLHGAEIERLRAALQEADTIMGHDDAETAWREKWAGLWPND